MATKEHNGNGISFLCIPGTTPLPEVLRIHGGATERGLPAGIALVVDDRGELRGVVTDGDVRRAILARGSIDLLARDAMTRNPILFPEGISYKEILRLLPAELEKRGRRSRRFLEKIVITSKDGRPRRVLDYHQLWEQRVATHRHVVVIGMGYVGLTLALELAREGFHVTGFDVDGTRVRQLARGESHVYEVGLEELLQEQLGSNFSVSSEMPDGDVYVVAVGTPVVASDEGVPRPALGDLESAIGFVGSRLVAGNLVVLRSTVPVGTSRRVVLPMLEEATGLEGGRDFHLAFAPERTAEGRALEELRTLSQIIGGINQDSVEATAALFRELTSTIVRVDSLEAAELAKLINNGFRDLSFAFANQVAQLAAQHDLDVVEVIRAANRGYPRNRVALPSPGVGGPCLTKDPYILASSGDEGTIGLFVEGRRVNESMPDMIVSSVLRQLERVGKSSIKSSVLVCGLAFKGRPETGDLRESPGIAIANLLRPHVGRLYGHDPIAAAEDIQAHGLDPVSLPDGFQGMDAVLFVNNHPSYEKTNVYTMTRSLAGPGIVFDGWHLFESEEVLRACPSVYVGLSFHRSSVER